MRAAQGYSYWPRQGCGSETPALLPLAGRGPGVGVLPRSRRALKDPPPAAATLPARGRDANSWRRARRLSGDALVRGLLETIEVGERRLGAGHQHAERLRLGDRQVRQHLAVDGDLCLAEAVDK